MARVPAFCQNPAASRPDCVRAAAFERDVMCSTHHAEPIMPTNKPTETDPNSELRSFEPLRVTLALGALLLGLILGIH